MKKINYPRLHETVYFEKLENGLSVYLLPKEGFNRTYVTLATNLGSVLGTVTKDTKKVDIPLGIAHFLEHKLFDQNGEDVSQKFALHHAQVNAFTQHNRTTYLFSCTKHLEENISTLLDFVFNPSFNDEGITREKSIITQEIKMYEDNTDAVVYMDLLKNMYAAHPVRDDILGTVDEINKIEKPMLEFIHNEFYNPSNMVLFATGNIDVDSLIETIKTTMPTINHSDLNTTISEPVMEDATVYKKEHILYRDILVPTTLFGVKLHPDVFLTNDIMKKELTLSILLDLMYGKSSQKYKKMLETGLINDTFGMEITLDKSYGFIMLGSDTNHPEALIDALRNDFSTMDSFEIDLESFKRTKKQVIGGFMHALNSLEYIAHQFTNYHYMNTSLFNVLDLASDITIDDLKQMMTSLTNPDSYSSTIILPKKMMPN